MSGEGAAPIKTSGTSCATVNKKLIFHHIPKCGGSSLRETLRMSLICGGVNPNTIYFAGLGKPNLMSNQELTSVWNEISKATAVLSHIDARFIPKVQGGQVVTCIRHPITRAISAFNHFPLMKEPDCVDLVTMFKSQRQKFDRLFANLYSRPGAYGLGHTDYAYVVVYERIYEDVPKMLEKLGLPVVPVPHVDPSPRVSHQHASRFKFDENNPDHQEIWQYLEKRLAPDIELYEKYLNRNI